MNKTSIIRNQTFDEERALYGSRDLLVEDSSFDGPADGESAFKECSNIRTQRCFFNLRYPFWHDHGLKISDSEMTELCRAALWYSDHIEITDTKMHGDQSAAGVQRCEAEWLRHCLSRVRLVGKRYGNGGLRRRERIFYDAFIHLQFRNVRNEREIFFPVYRGCRLLKTVPLTQRMLSGTRRTLL